MPNRTTKCYKKQVMSSLFGDMVPRFKKNPFDFCLKHDPVSTLNGLYLYLNTL